MVLDLTERERLVISHALHRFAMGARDRFDVANQRMRTTMHAPFSALEAAKFLQDAKDAEALIERLRAASKGGADARSVD
jgi:hypothetical protein